MKYLALFALTWLAACNTPSPEFKGIAPTRVTVDGSTFDVRVDGQKAEALRVNAQYAPRFGPIRDRAARAMAQVSGCEVRKVTGDQALAFGALKCGGKEPVRRKTRQEFECLPQRGTEIKDGFGGVTVEVDCYPT